MKIEPGFNSKKHEKNQLELSRKLKRKKFFVAAGISVGWSTWFFASFFAARFLMSVGVFAVSQIAGFNPAKMSDFGNALAEIFFYLCLAIFFVFLPLIFLPKFHKNNSQKLSKNSLKKFAKIAGFSRKPKLEDFAWAVWFLPFFYVILVFANFAAMFIFGATTMKQEQILPFAGSGEGFSQLVIIFFSLVVVAPVFEEFLLRGWMFGKLREKMNFLLAAMIISLVFAAAHGQINVGIMTFILSMFGSKIREKTGVIYGAIFLHMAVNFLAFSIRYLGFLHGGNFGV